MTTVLSDAQEGYFFAWRILVTSRVFARPPLNDVEI